jgi:hypothetical protein
VEPQIRHSTCRQPRTSAALVGSRREQLALGKANERREAARASQGELPRHTCPSVRSMPHPNPPPQAQGDRISLKMVLNGR